LVVFGFISLSIDKNGKCNQLNNNEKIFEVLKDAVLKEFEVKNHRVQPFLKVKMLDLNRTTLPLYKRLDEKNKNLTNQYCEKLY